MSDTAGWVALGYRFNPGWPWPEDSLGLDPMYGPEGWCHGCGTPNGPQTGHLTLQGSGFPSATVFVPNWRHDSICIDAATANAVASRFAVELREVHKPRSGPTGVQQFLPEVTEANWYAKRDLRRAVRRRHARHNGRRVGSKCAECGRWRWLPLMAGDVSPHLASLSTGNDVIASPEFFGDGWKSFRHLLFRRELADLLVEANPRTFSIREVLA